ncbi:MAG: hypothetical protein ACP5I1_09175 [Candidatus Hinthialibacter sp.]
MYCLRAASLFLCLICMSCSPKTDDGADPQAASMGRFEITAQLVEIPEPFPDIPLYDYAYVLKYKVLTVHRGELEADVIYVAHYNPLKPRDQVADVRSGEIGGNLKKIKAGDVHRMALDEPIDDFYMGGIINKYFEQETGPIYWALWTNQVIQ